ncbi:MAG: four helix bundle protein [Candidatus Buchananbacteria bacterium]|nr:four helix bundle protein [Candidatus Buchananbacteria bacterium]
MATGLENLKIYQMAERFELEVYQITKQFPKDERFRSIDQLLRSSASVANNIAESYNRVTVKEKVRCCVIAKAEAEETKRNILRSAKKNFIDQVIAHNLANKYTELLKAISGYIRFLKKC